MLLNEKTLEILTMAGLGSDSASLPLEVLSQSETRYLRDLKLNLKKVFNPDHLSTKEAVLMALSIAANAKNDKLMQWFSNAAREEEASADEIAEAIACASLLASNNVLYRFRHFANKQKYEDIPARIRMNIMMSPVTGKEFFELMSLAVSAVNGCERCVKAHEESVLHLGSNEERIFEAIRIASIIESADRVIR